MAALRKPKLPLICEPDEGYIHYAPPVGMDQVTLCGITDWIHAKKKGYPVESGVMNCNACKWIVDFVNQHEEPK